MTSTMCDMVNKAFHSANPVFPTFDELSQELIRLANATEEKNLIPTHYLEALINGMNLTTEQMKEMWYLVYATESSIRQNPRLDNRYRNSPLTDAVDKMHSKYVVATGINLMQEMIYGTQLSEHEKNLIASM